MAYFTVNGTDLSPYISGLRITERANYEEQLNAVGNKKVDYKSTKREIEATFRPMISSEMTTVLTAISFSNTISFRNPKTGAVETGVSAIVGEKGIQYYTIRTDLVSFNTMVIVFKEL